MDSIPASQIIGALLDMADENQLQLPHGLPPLLTEEEYDQTSWGMLKWNPSQGQEHLGVDNLASTKPSWEVLAGHCSRVGILKMKDDMLSAVSDACKREISAAYGASSFEDELQKRLRGGTTVEQDGERDRLRGRYRSVKNEINQALDKPALEAIQRRIADGTWKESE